MARRIQSKKLGFLVVVIILVVVLAIFVPKLFSSGGSSRSQTGVQNTELKPTRALQDINKEFQFPISQADKTRKIKIVIQKAELMDEIVVKGQKATAVAGRTFLILELKIVNDLDIALTMNTRDYVRLSVNKNDKELLAPDIHNDPVEIQAISTKYTRLGFPVNITDHDFVLQLGEIKGDKQKINLSLSK